RAKEWACWRVLWIGTALNSGSLGNPEAAKGWLDRLKEAKLAAAALRAARQVLDDANRDERRARDALLRAAGLIGLPLDPELDVDPLRQKVGAAIEAARERWDD